ncbi:MAG: hypothetical protein H6734_06545 [Alphaproteobacteria bacterium]|nr:hypothetical protein [Alphaproteobacteria bacterium]
MMVSNQGSVVALLGWQRDKVVQFGVAATVAFVLYQLQALTPFPELFTMNTTAMGVVGGAIGIFVSFRTNSAYARWWEGRQLWGRLINTSRHFSTQALHFVGDKDDTLARDLVRRQIAYVHALRCLLRVQEPLDDDRVKKYLTPEEIEELRGQSNLTHAILHLNHRDFTLAADVHGISPHRLQQLDESTRHLLDIQGGCERIKKTPLPRGYGFIAETLIKYYSYLLPFALVGDLHVLAIPMSVLVCMAFTLINEAGRVLEDPFTMFWNGLPLFAMSRTIENDLRSRMGERDLEPLPVPDAQGILM